MAMVTLVLVKTAKSKRAAAMDHTGPTGASKQIQQRRSNVAQKSTATAARGSSEKNKYFINL
jgi:hypothetical protein